jgi:hypothetical protein
MRATMPHHNHFDASWLFIAILTLTWIAIGLRELCFAIKTKQRRNIYENQGEPYHDHDRTRSHPESHPPGGPQRGTADTPGTH